MKKKIFINKKNWHHKKVADCEVFLKSFGNKKEVGSILNYLLFETNLKKIKKYIQSMQNNFLIIIKNKNTILASTDKIRSFPLLYYYDKKKFFLFENYNLVRNLKLNNKINKEQTMLFSLSGYTFADETVYQNIKQLNQGTLLKYSNNKISLHNYFTYNNKNQYKKINLEAKLENVNEKIILKLIDSCKGKHIVLPLSAGYDSRFILSGLKEFGYKNITTFSYGRKRNREAEIAKSISKEINVPWHYIPYTNKKLINAIKSLKHKSYEKYADNLTSIFFPQDFLAIEYLQDKKIIPKNSVIVNGQSGDFISGNHLPNLNYKDKSILEKLVNYYINKHFNLWTKYYEKQKSFLFKKVFSYVKDKMKPEKGFEYKIYETLEFENRQCKYVINGQRLYEFFNYEWRLPLWDSLYLEFWSKVPLREKLNQNLYKRTIHKTNWGGVWNNIPVNPKNTFTYDIEIIRFFFKSLFLLKGKNHWHNFEKKYLNYFIDPLCGFAQWKYYDVVKDKRLFRNSLSWQTEKYLALKNIDWEKLV